MLCWRNRIFNLIFFFFCKNSYPKDLSFRNVNRFLNNIYRPKAVEITVSKDHYISVPYLGFQKDKFIKALNSLIKKHYPAISFTFAPINSLSRGNFFKFKRHIAQWHEIRSNLSIHLSQMHFGNWYLLTYKGCTERMLRVRVAGHLGVSHRTNSNLGVKKSRQPFETT